MEYLKEDLEVKREINRLSMRVAILRYDLREALKINTPLGMLKDVMAEICILQEQKLLLEMGRFDLLPYNVRVLYR
jgi:predicted component of viral defense system (DUF524 family)